jgi:ABC-2 type transport system ATP-binding protein
MAGVTRSFNGADAVSSIDLTIPTGTVVGVIGPSGSGKTTTIRMITGSLGPTSGKVEVLGEDPSRFSRGSRERIGYMPQLFSLYPDLTVGENVDFAASLAGLVLWRRWRRRKEVLQLVDLWDVRKRRAGKLSGGMKRRLELAAALVHEPQLLILDEPTAGIDPLPRRTIWDEIHRLRDAGVT